ncbi:MAG TPA: hypothetical protein PLP81_06455 [Saprospiraceae bacterium]|nr:hypothetical protein [Saprospiraceae bacterium]MCC6688620.1 hypothetical protein [Saprospiraceae bacterium]HMV24684.1 hypothetical protein [Saprospiraceae bacterium]HNA41712.1 hypothetical protein [Saprospiraceae bacterium]HNL29810.1 hypothetical protein [Saprospiraceae bacterium]
MTKGLRLSRFLDRSVFYSQGVFSGESRRKSRVAVPGEVIVHEILLDLHAGWA